MSPFTAALVSGSPSRRATVNARYDWTRHVTVPVAVFADKASADAELERLKAEEVELRASARRAAA